MKIVFLSVWFSDKMGYIENCLPKALAKLGHEVHVVSSTAQVYYNELNFESIYKPYLGENILQPGKSQIDGFTLHRLPFRTIGGKILIKNLGKKLKEIEPDIVQSFDPFSFITLQGAFYKLHLSYKYFTANHIVASVFPLYHKDKNNLIKKTLFFFTRTMPGKLISVVTSRCYPATIDALEIAVKYYGIPKHKAKLVPLGVDTDFFFPLQNDKRNDIRKDMSVSSNDLLCIYTGRFTEGKNPLLLAKAIHKLVEMNEPFKALFLGDGPQKEEINKLKGCIVHDFIPYHELPNFYRIADIGVWPRQESTSMLDATACGLPIIISNRVQAKERIEGNGLTYIENDVDDLVRALLKMKNKELRSEFSETGIDKIKIKYSWSSIAADREKDYLEFLKNKQ
ncbi:MAG: glycosyltransferase family 4 protein [Bacteroidales bacterium]